MTERLRQVAESVNSMLERAEHLPPTEQDALAARIEELMNELRWDQLLASPDHVAALEALADEAHADFAAGRTLPLSEVFGDEELE